jgi:hypothetical protein
MALGEEGSFRELFEKKLEEMAASKDNTWLLSTQKYKDIVEDLREALRKKAAKESLTTKEYRRLSKYDLLSLGGVEKLICAKSKPEIKYYLKMEELYEVMNAAHVDTGHKRQRVMEIQLRKKYSNVTGEVISTFLGFCKICERKKKHPKKGLVIKPMVFSEMNSRCQVIFYHIVALTGSRECT